MAWSLKSIFAKKTQPDSPSYPRRSFSYSAGTIVTDDTALKVSAMYRGVSYISTQIAKLPWDLKDSSNNVVNDGISKLLNLSPNDETNAMILRMWIVSNAILKGNSYLEIERNRIGTPIAIWPIPSQNVEPYRKVIGGKLWYRVTGNSTDQGDVYLDPKDVLHFKNLHTKDGITGQGVTAYAAETLGISLAADKMAGNLFANSGIPSGILKHKGILSDEAYKRLEASWLANNSGTKSGGTAILEEDMSFEGINVDPQVLQFLESRKFGVLEIARFLGLPPTKLFDITAATYSNVENSNLEVATDTLDAWACNLEMEVDVKLLNNRYGGRYTELDLYSVFRGDMASRSTYFKNMMSLGAMTPNQVRNKEGMASYPEGDRYYIATNNFSPADRVDEIIDAQVAKSQPAPAPAPSPEPTAKSAATAALEDAALEYLTRKN